uniref:Uncharacterized protein n=1 Tax=Musca domestica TaxID=7370 RepID=A0A1I8NJU9_MUSDO
MTKYNNIITNVKIKHENKTKMKILMALKKYISINYHQMLADNPYLFHKYLHLHNNDKALVDSINNYQENVLHIACKSDMTSTLIKPLIQCGCSPTKQDLQGRTPLHVALELRQYSCIKEFLLLFHTHMLYPKEIVDRLKHMFQIYNRAGHTIVHEAVIRNEPDILRELLRICQQHDINVLDNEVLGSGDTLLHLAINRKVDTEIIDIIIDYLPEIVHISNYSGMLAMDGTDAESKVT